MASVQVNIRELKNRLSHYLRLTKAGQTVEITERGKPIGRIVPITPPLEERLDAMAKLGLLVRGKGKLPPTSPVARVRGSKSVADLLIEARE
jgi:prevent-host-death family protein